MIQLKQKLPLYARPAVKVQLRHDDKAYFSAQARLDLDQTFKDYLQSEINKLSSCKPLKITGLSEKEKEDIERKVKVIYTKQIAPKLTNHQPNQNNLKINGSKIGIKFCEDFDSEEKENKNEETKYNGNSYKARPNFV